MTAPLAHKQRGKARRLPIGAMATGRRGQVGHPVRQLHPTTGKAYEQQAGVAEPPPTYVVVTDAKELDRFDGPAPRVGHSALGNLLPAT